MGAFSICKYGSITDFLSGHLGSDLGNDNYKRNKEIAGGGGGGECWGECNHWRAAHLRVSSRDCHWLSRQMKGFALLACTVRAVRSSRVCRGITRHLCAIAGTSSAVMMVDSGAHLENTRQYESIQ